MFKTHTQAFNIKFVFISSLADMGHDTNRYKSKNIRSVIFAYFYKIQLKNAISKRETYIIAHN